MGGRDYPFEELGIRARPDAGEARALAGAASREGGSRRVPAEARTFQQRAARELSTYPAHRPLPRWVRALIEKKVSPEEFAKTVHDRTLRAPSAENLELALLLANEVSRWPEGPAIVQRYLTPELVERASGGGRVDR